MRSSRAGVAVGKLNPTNLRVWESAGTEPLEIEEFAENIPNLG